MTETHSRALGHAALSAFLERRHAAPASSSVTEEEARQDEIAVAAHALTGPERAYLLRGLSRLSRTVFGKKGRAV